MNGIIRATIERHQVGAFCGSDTACACDRRWRKNDEYRDHLAEQIAAAISEADRWPSESELTLDAMRAELDS